MSLIDQLCDADGLRRALGHVLSPSQRRIAGVDGRTPAAFEREAAFLLGSLCLKLAMGTYKPKPYRLVEIPKLTGSTRKLCIPTVVDRIVARRIYEILEPLLASQLSPFRFGFRKGHGTIAAIREAQRLIRAGNVWVLVADIENCFPSVPREAGMRRLIRAVKDDDACFLRVVRDQVYAPVSCDGQILESTGFPQGVAHSPILLDLFLAPPDTQVGNQVGPFVRYADNYLLACRSAEECSAALDLLTSLLEQEGGLRLKPGSTIVDVRTQPAEFLSFAILASSVQIAPKSLVAIEKQATLKAEQEGAAKGLEYLSCVDNYYRHLADTSPLKVIGASIRTCSRTPVVCSPTPQTAAQPPQGPGLLRPSPSGVVARGGAGEYPPPPGGLSPKDRKKPRRGRTKRFANGEPMYWVNYPVTADRLNFSAGVLRTLSREVGSDKLGYLWDLIALDFLATNSFEYPDRKEFLARLFKRLEIAHKLKVVALDPKSGEFVYGQWHAAQDDSAAKGVDDDGTAGPVPSVPEPCPCG